MYLRNANVRLYTAVGLCKIMNETFRNHINYNIVQIRVWAQFLILIKGNETKQNEACI